MAVTPDWMGSIALREQNMAFFQGQINPSRTKHRLFYEYERVKFTDDPADS
jgi:hypothetical protein